MAAPLIVVVFVAMGEAHAPTTDAMTATAQDVLGPNAIVLVRGVEAIPADAEALRLAGVLHADAVVEVTWPDADRHRARVRVHVGKTDTWTERDLTFAAADAPNERGRTVGFAVASMIPGEGKTEDRPAGATPPGPVVRLPGKPPPAEVPRHRVEVDLVAIGSRGVSGYAGGFGGELSARVPIGMVFVRAGVGLRLGSIPLPRVDAAATALRLDVGISVPVLRLERPALAFGARCDVVVLRHALSRPTVDLGDASRDARWLMGFDGVLEGAWSFHPDAAVVAGMGMEVALGTTRVFVGDTVAAEIPRTRLLGEIGLRARF